MSIGMTDLAMDRQDTATFPPSEGKITETSREQLKSIKSEEANGPRGDDDLTLSNSETNINNNPWM